MKVYLPVDSKQTLGGGFSFVRNISEGLRRRGVEVVFDYTKADIALISGATMISKETFRTLRDSKVKTVVRLDNVPRNSRNRGSGTSRLKGFSQQADAVIWQSHWAKGYLQDFIDPDEKRKSAVIYNGIDTEVFKPLGEKIDILEGLDRENTYLYSRFSRDETKMWEVAWYEYQMIQRRNPDAILLIIGRYSEDLQNNAFDFFRNERTRYLGIFENSQDIAKLLRSCGHLLATYYNDAFSNTYLEALCSGVDLYKPNMSGGTPEMLDMFNAHGRDYFSLERMADDYIKFFEELL